MKRKETFADHAAAFIVGALIGVLVAWVLRTFERVESGGLLIGVIIGSGFFAAVAWRPFWAFVVSVFNLEKW